MVFVSFIHEMIFYKCKWTDNGYMRPIHDWHSNWIKFSVLYVKMRSVRIFIWIQRHTDIYGFSMKWENQKRRHDERNKGSKTKQNRIAEDLFSLFLLISFKDKTIYYDSKWMKIYIRNWDVISILFFSRQKALTTKRLFYIIQFRFSMLLGPYIMK